MANIPGLWISPYISPGEYKAPNYDPGALYTNKTAPTASSTTWTNPNPPSSSVSNPVPQTPSQPPQPSQEEILKNEYINQLNQMYDPMLANLDPQRASQEQIVTNNYNQGVSDIGVQEQQGMADLATQERKVGENQKSTLQDLADNIRNLFMAGNVYLGARGAGDSSASNMYSYAINKVGSKQRGDVMSQSASMVNDIRDRESRLKNTVIQATKQLETEKNNQLANISQWFYDAQNQIRGMKGQDLAALSNTLLQNAINKLNTIDTDYRNKANMLTEWAANNSTTIEGLKQKVAQIPGVLGQLPSYTPMSGLSYSGGGNYVAPVGMGMTTEEKKY